MKHTYSQIVISFLMLILVGCGKQLAQTGAQLQTPTQPVDLTQSVTAEAVIDNLQPLVAFYSDRDGNPEIYIMRFDGSLLTRLTDDPSHDDSPAISPDGKRVVFLSARHDPEPEFPNLKYELYLVNIDGSGLTRLTNTPAAEDHPAWSPDGSRIIFDADYDGDGYNEIYTITTDGGSLTRLTENAANDQFADWSPDGSQIAFSSDRNGGWDIFVMNVDGSDQRSLTDSAGWEVFPAWSPDGRLIAFNFLAPGSRNTDVYVMDSMESDVRALTSRAGFDENPVWSADGGQIMYQTEVNGNFELAVMNADGTDQRILLPSHADELWPSWWMPQSTADIIFLKSTQDFPDVPTYKIRLADLDADGDLDAVIANCKQITAQVLLNDGSGYLIDSLQDLGWYGHGAAVGDVDGDGDPDVVISVYKSSYPTRVYLNDGTAVFKELSGAFRTNVGYTVELIDLDGDGDLDAAGEDNTATHIFWNDGGGFFSSEPGRYPVGAVWGDLDLDGDQDMFGKIEGTGYALQFNDGTGSFSEPRLIEDVQAMALGGIALGDLDRDGDLDVVVTNGHHASKSFSAFVMLNDGNGFFARTVQIFDPVKNSEPVLGDLDLDGDLDLVLSDHFEACQIWLNDGTGMFVDSGFRFGGDQFYSDAQLGDLDGDGDLDIMLSTFGNTHGPNEIWFNQTIESILSSP